MEMERIIGLLFSGFSMRLASAAFAIWMASYAVIAVTDAMERVSAAM